MPERLVPVILCGGSGSRLWPMSRQLLPKQFLPLVTEHTLLQDTVLRLQGLEDCGAPVAVLNHEHRFPRRGAAAGGRRESALAAARADRPQHCARGGGGSAACRAGGSAAVLLVLPADHLIADASAFRAAVRKAVAIAQEGLLVTFGIAPTHPATGFGYIEAGEAIAGQDGAFRIRRFIEKPDAHKGASAFSTRAALLERRMFAFTAQRVSRRARAAAARDPRRNTQGARRLGAGPGFPAPRARGVRRLSVGLDRLRRHGANDPRRRRARRHGVERRRFLVRAVGNERAGRCGQRDAGRRLAARCAALLVRADARHVSVLGAQDLVIVETDDALLVAARDHAQEVKEVVAQLDRQKRSEHVSHTRVYRPWGYYESVDSGERFQVKRLMVKPGHGLSLQLHRKRASTGSSSRAARPSRAARKP
jgi:mannose-1-phosphate guanylyltransferase